MIRISSKNRSRFDISENVLLAPTWDSRVSRKDDRIIKAALFDFIFTSDRKPQTTQLWIQPRNVSTQM